MNGTITRLGKFVPTSFSRPTIERELDEHLAKEGLSWASRFVRKPNQVAAYGAKQRDWHHDDNPWEWVVIWSNTGGTEFRANGQEFTAEPFEVILFSDKELEHRAPTNGAPRWFARFDDVSTRSPEA